jgi:hypothetical protein
MMFKLFIQKKIMRLDLFILKLFDFLCFFAMMYQKIIKFVLYNIVVKHIFIKILWRKNMFLNLNL